MHLSIDGFLGCFYLLAVMNNVAIPVCVQVSVYVFISLGYRSIKAVQKPFSGLHSCMLCARAIKQTQSGWEGKVS